MTSHLIKRPYGKIERCDRNPLNCPECADELAVLIWYGDKQAMATMGRESAWDANGREVEA